MLRLYLICLLSTLVLLGSCAKDKDSNPTPRSPEPTTRARNAEAKPAARAESPAWPLGQEHVDKSLAAARELHAAIDRLLSSTTIENLEQAQAAWRKTAQQFEQFYVFTRLGTVAPELFLELSDLQFNINAWPIQPGYLDSYGVHPYSGIVFDVGMPITEEALREQHGMTDRADATLGLYAVEFLLFGEQNDRGPLVFQPITALNEKYREDGYQDVAELPRNRRRELLRLQTRILSTDLTQLQTLWSSTQPGQIRYKFETLTAAQQSELLRKAALTLATEQLVTLANRQKPANSLATGNELWQNQQLADRLMAQLQGLQRLNQILNLGTTTESAINAGLAALSAAVNLPPITDKGAPAQVNWQEIYTTLRELARSLNPESGPAALPTEPTTMEPEAPPEPAENFPE